MRTDAPPPVIEHGLGPHREWLDMLTGAVGVSEVPDTVALVREYLREEPSGGREVLLEELHRRL